VIVRTVEAEPGAVDQERAAGAQIEGRKVAGERGERDIIGERDCVAGRDQRVIRAAQADGDERGIEIRRRADREAGLERDDIGAAMAVRLQADMIPVCVGSKFSVPTAVPAEFFSVRTLWASSEALVAAMPCRSMMFPGANPLISEEGVPLEKSGSRGRDGAKA